MKLRVDALPKVQYGPWLKSDDRLPSFLDTHNWQMYLFGVVLLENFIFTTYYRCHACGENFV